MKPISKAEAKNIKRRLNSILENFNSFNRHQLREKLIKLGKYCNPSKQENDRLLEKQTLKQAARRLATEFDGFQEGDYDGGELEEAIIEVERLTKP